MSRRSDEFAKNYLGAMLFCWIAGWLTHGLMIPGIMEWLTSNNLPTWWLWLLDKVTGLPRLMYHLYSGTTVFEFFYIIVGNMAFPVLFAISLVITLFLAIAALIQAGVVAFWPYLLGILAVIIVIAALPTRQRTQE